MRLGVEIIAPPAYRLRDSYSGSNKIQKLQRIYLPHMAQNDDGKDPEYQPAMYRQSSPSYVYHLHKIAGVIRPVEYDIIQPGADYSHRNCDYHDIKQPVGIQTVQRSSSAAQHYSDDHPCRYHDGIPHYIYAEYCECHRVRNWKSSHVYHLSYQTFLVNCSPQ